MAAGKPALNQPAAALIDAFGDLISVSDGNIAGLRAVLAGSAYLTHQLNTAASRGDLTSFDVLLPGAHLGGEYTAATRSVGLSPTMVDDPIETAFVLGHEVQHALKRRQLGRADGEFQTDLVDAAQGDRDYTPAAQKMISALRDDEAVANLAGWNAMIDYVHDHHPTADLDDISRLTPRAADFLTRQPDTGRQRLKPDLAIGQDQHFEFTAGNVEAMARHYFDKPAHEARLGFHGNSDYAHRYGSWIAGAVVECDRFHHPAAEQPLRFDLGRCGLRHELLEQNGIDFGAVDHEPMPFLDASTQPPTRAAFHHTAQSHRFEAEPSAPATSLAGLAFARPAVQAPAGNRQPSLGAVSSGARAPVTAQFGGDRLADRHRDGRSR